MPRHVFVVDGSEIPQTPTGKVRKFELVPRAQQLLGVDAAVRRLSPADL